MKGCLNHLEKEKLLSYSYFLGISRTCALLPPRASWTSQQILDGYRYFLSFRLKKVSPASGQEIVLTQTACLLHFSP